MRHSLNVLFMEISQPNRNVVNIANKLTEL